MAIPADTEPPGELMYRVMSFVGSSLARYRSWATSTFAHSSFTYGGYGRYPKGGVKNEEDGG